MAIFEETSIF